MGNHLTLTKGVFYSFGVSAVLSLLLLLLMWLTRGGDVTLAFIRSYFVLQLAVLTLILLPVVMKFSWGPSRDDR